MKKVIAGFIAGMIFATAGSVMASSVIEKVTASIRSDYKLEVDGKMVDLKSPPLVYNGTAHLPLRAVGEVLGKEVDFVDGYKITLSSKGEGTVPEVKLSKAEFEKEIERLGIELAQHQAQANATVSAIASIDARQDDSEQERRNELEKIKIEIEVKVKATEKAIAELKTKYPEYAESAK